MAQQLTRVWLIDVDKEAEARIRQHLSLTTCELTSIAWTETAWPAWDPSDVDLVVIDNNLLILHHIRSTQPRIPVLMLTLQDEDAMGEQALQAGAHEFLGKDQLTPAHLKRVIRCAIEHSQLEIKQQALETMRNQWVEFASHHFRTPLTAIRLATELLQAYEDQPQRKQPYYQQIKAAIQTLDSLLDQVLNPASS